MWFQRVRFKLRSFWTNQTYPVTIASLDFGSDQLVSVLHFHGQLWSLFWLFDKQPKTCRGILEHEKLTSMLIHEGLDAEMYKLWRHILFNDCTKILEYACLIMMVPNLIPGLLNQELSFSPNKNERWKTRVLAQIYIMLLNGFLSLWSSLTFSGHRRLQTVIQNFILNRLK